MSDPAKPRPFIASLAASAAWLGPWIAFMSIVGERNNDKAVGYGLFLAMAPVALGVGTLIWRIIGAVLRAGAPPLKPFMIRGALLVAGLVLVIQLWSLWSIRNAPPPVCLGEAIFLSLATVAALGLTALPAAAVWWKLAVRPAVSET